MSEIKIRCNECWNHVVPIIKKGGPDWFDSYFCPDCEDGTGKEIARISNKDGRYVWWNGYQFQKAKNPYEGERKYLEELNKNDV